MTAITAPVRAEHRDATLRRLAASRDDETRCATCLMVTDLDDLTDRDGGTCLPCDTARYGQDTADERERRAS